MTQTLGAGAGTQGVAEGCRAKMIYALEGGIVNMILCRAGRS